MYFNPQEKGGTGGKKAKVIKVLREKVANIKPVVVNKEELVVNEPEVVVNKTKHGVYADREKRKVYMREYMRRKRGKAKS